MKDAGAVKHPLTGAVLPPTPLLGSAEEIPAGIDPRERLVNWMTSPSNPFFAKVIVNRVWAELMGRGIVDPVDDLRDTNPPANPALLEALAVEFRAQKYDLKKLIRTVAMSKTFALNSTPTERNVGDTRNFSRRYRIRMRAETLLDSVADVTGVPEKFDAVPAGSRATEAWTVRFDSKFLDSFGRPDPNQDPPCERVSETTVVQALHLMNAPGLAAKITNDAGRCATLAAGQKSPGEIVDELYLLTYCRKPTADETATCVARFAKAGVTNRQATEDLMWALLEHARIYVRGLTGDGPMPSLTPAGTRRDFLQLGLGTLLGGGLTTALRARTPDGAVAAQAKSCILIWMDGGPTHYETFDPKPDAPAEIRGEFKPLATKTPGMFVSEHMTKLAAMSDKLALVRSIRHDQGNHGAGNHYMMTGAPPRIPVGCGAFVSFHPSLGSVVAHEKPAKAGLPSYFSLPSMSRSGGPNFLGASYAPFVVDGDPSTRTSASATWPCPWA